MPEIHVSAGVLVDESGRAIVVRKRGARVFQQPGGKPDPGESAIQALLREVQEEIGVHLDAATVRYLGTFRDVAANEPGHTVVAEGFAARIRAADVAAAAEIEEIRWITEDEAGTVPLANLSRNHLLRHAWR